MLGYLRRRLGLTLLLLWLVATLLFLFVHIMPGDPAQVILGSSETDQPTPEQLEMVRKKLGLDRPLQVQYATYLAGLVRGDMGRSFLTGRPVALDLRLRLVRTLQLIIPAITLSSLLGIALGTLAASRRGSLWDPLLSSFALLGFSIPVFVSGNILVLILALRLGFLPSGGWVEFSQEPIRFFSYLLMPMLALAMGPMATTMRMARAAVVEQLGLDYVRTARAKGLSQRVVLYRHVLKNALMPVVTVIGLQVGSMFAGSVLVEYIFNWPGLNSLLIRSIGDRDYPIIQGTVLLASFIFVLINLVTDLSYAWLNPRLRYE